MVFASPAPQVEPAIAASAPIEDPAVAEQAVPCSDSVHVDPAQKVDPAVPIDDPMKYAPESVKTAKAHVIKPLSVESLSEMNHNGNDFECEAAVIRGKPQKNILRRLLPWIFDERDFVAYGEVRKYIYVKDKLTCFVYVDKHDPSPLYAIDMLEYNAVLEDPHRLDPQSFTVSPVPNSNKSRPEMITVLLKNKVTKEQCYQFTFDTANQQNAAKEFYDLFSGNSTPNLKAHVSIDAEKNPKKNPSETKQDEDHIKKAGVGVPSPTKKIKVDISSL